MPFKSEKKNLNFLTEQGGAEAFQHMVYHGPFCDWAAIVQETRKDLVYSRSWGKLFPALRKDRQHFLSQNNLSLWLTRLPAIFTQLKLQMIYFQLQYSASPRHMVLSIKPNSTVQKCPIQCEYFTMLTQMKQATQKIWKRTEIGAEERGNACGDWFVFPLLVGFC